MRRLPRPLAEAEAVLLACADEESSPDLAARIKAAVPFVESCAQAFRSAMNAGREHTLKPDKFAVPGISKKEMSAVYSKDLVGGRRRGRANYLAIRSISVWCWACSNHQSQTLDHHLPKSRFPALALVPLNLTPMCRWCNDAKSTWVSSGSGENLVHPYFESYDGITWLIATLQVLPEPHFEFAASDRGLTGVQRTRAASHIKRFKLDELYRVEAARLITQQSRSLLRTLEGAGAGAVESLLRDLEEQARSWEPNSWQAAVWRAARVDPWFLNGGFQEFGA